MADTVKPFTGYWGINATARRFTRLMDAIRHAKYLAERMKMTVRVNGVAGGKSLSWEVTPQGEVRRLRE